MTRFRKGMTFVEVMLVITVLGAMLVITMPLIDAGLESWSFVVGRSEWWQKGELAMMRATQEIREVRSISDVLTADADNFRFISVDGDDIMYSFSGSTLSRNGDALLTGVNAFSFYYYDGMGNQIVSPLVSPLNTDLRNVRIYFVIGSTANTFALQTDVHPRNIE